MSKWNYQLIHDSQELDRCPAQPGMYKKTGQFFKGLHLNYVRIVQEDNAANCVFPGQKMNLSLKCGAVPV